MNKPEKTHKLRSNSVYRGGSWTNYQQFVRVAYRYSVAGPLACLGVRLVEVLDEQD
jgi:hypothetical protein